MLSRNTIIAILFLILAYVSWETYQIPAVTIGDTTYAIFIFIPFLCLIMAGLFIAFGLDESSKEKHAAFKHKGSSSRQAIKHYRTTKKTKKEKTKMSKSQKISIPALFIVGVTGPMLVCAGIFGFAAGAPDPLGVYSNPTYQDMIIFISKDTWCRTRS